METQRESRTLLQVFGNFGRPVAHFLSCSWTWRQKFVFDSMHPKNCAPLARCSSSVENVRFFFFFFQINFFFLFFSSVFWHQDVERKRVPRLTLMLAPNSRDEVLVSGSTWCPQKFRAVLCARKERKSCAHVTCTCRCRQMLCK